MSSLPTTGPPATMSSSSSSSSIARESSSTIVATTASGSHVLKIDGYTRTKGLATGIHLKSCSFHVGGHSWHLAYLPNGDSAQNADFISFYLVLEDAPANGAPVLAQLCVALLDRAGKPVPSHTQARPVTRFAAHAAHWGFKTFIRRDVLEKSRYLNLKDDSFCVLCEVNVVTGFRAEDATAAAAAAPCVRVPPPDLSRNFGELLRTELGADVRFRVDGEDFAAHRCVLAVRSPVFQAQLFGAMKEAASSSVSGEHSWVEIDDMRADVFRNLLHFIYTDELPTQPDEPQEEEALNMAQHLLVAADRYGMERLRLICEDVMCRHIDVSTVATTLALAEQHRCQGLKEACFQFLNKSPGSLNAVMATDGFDHLANSCPAIIKELMSRLAATHSK